MGFEKITKKLFKKPSILIPDEFLNKCDIEKGSYLVDVEYSPNFILLSTSNRAKNNFTTEINAIISEKPDDSDTSIGFKFANEDVSYSKVIGFFMFRDAIYYKAKNSSGRRIDNIDISFIEDIKNRFPDEYGEIKLKDISGVNVTPLIINK